MGIPMDIVYVPDEYGNLIQTRVPTAIGFPTWFAGPEVPDGYLYCDGSEVDREVYKELFAAIGTTWGAGDGTDTFNIPDLRGIFVRGDGGENNAALGTVQSDAMRNITGSFWDYLGQAITLMGVGDGVFRRATSDDEYGTMLTVTDTSLRYPDPEVPDGMIFDASRVVPTAPEIRPINVALKPCIRYV